MTRGTVTKLLILADVAALALIIWTGVQIARHPSPPPINHCPPSDAANRWCVQ
jgi:hypothetical protein